MRSKKGFVVTQQMVVMILSVVIIAFLIIMALFYFGDIRGKQRQANLLDLEQGVRGITEVLATKLGSTDGLQLSLGGLNGETVCFFDLDHVDTILGDPLFGQDYPLVRDSLSSDKSKNMFFIHTDGTIEPLYGGPICFDNYPYYACVPIISDVVDLLFEGKNGCTTLTVNLSDTPVNPINDSKYAPNPLFIIQPLNRSASIVNWRDIVRVVPLTSFRHNEEHLMYPLVLPYIPGSPVASLSTSTILSLMSEGGKSTAYIFDTSVSGALPAGATAFQTSSMSYFSFWDEINTVVVIDPANKRSAVVASLLAGSLHAPLIMVNDSNLNTYKPHIKDNYVFIVVNPTYPSLQPLTDAYITTYASDVQPIDESFLKSSALGNFSKLQSLARID